MKSAVPNAVETLVDSLGACLTPDTARRLLTLKAGRKLKARVDYFAERSSEGTLTPAEHAEYANVISYTTFVAILKSKARQLLAQPERS
jgi:hypothetical protein